MLVVENELLMRQRCRFYTDYIVELYTMREDEIKFADIVKNFNKIQECVNSDNNNISWWDLCNDGFIIFETNIDDNGTTYIIDSYIKPESRRKGVMTNWINAISKEYGKHFIIEIINNNEVAFKFWSSLGILEKTTPLFDDDKVTTYYLTIH